MNYYNKALVAFLGATSTWGITAWQNDQHITGDEWFGLLGVLATVAAVFAVHNEPLPPA